MPSNELLLAARAASVCFMKSRAYRYKVEHTQATVELHTRLRASRLPGSMLLLPPEQKDENRLVQRDALLGTVPPAGGAGAADVSQSTPRRDLAAMGGSAGPCTAPWTPVPPREVLPRAAQPNHRLPVAVAASNDNTRGAEFAFSAADFEHVRKLIYQRAGISLHAGKQAMVYSRLTRRLREVAPPFGSASTSSNWSRATGPAGRGGVAGVRELPDDEPHLLLPRRAPLPLAGRRTCSARCRGGRAPAAHLVQRRLHGRGTLLPGDHGGRDAGVCRPQVEGAVQRHRHQRAGTVPSAASTAHRRTRAQSRPAQAPLHARRGRQQRHDPRQARTGAAAASSAASTS
jgi:hypothetical protein